MAAGTLEGMAVIKINKHPARRDLVVFGLALPVLAAVVGALARFRWHAPGAALGIWVVGAVVTAAYWAIPPLRRLIYLGWVYVTYPIGFVVSHVVLAFAYYVVLTPVGLLMRLFGRDPLKRVFDPAATTYWVVHDDRTDVREYFRQY